MTRPSALAVSVTALFFLGVGCKKPPPPDVVDASARPVDHLVRDEIPEGHDKAFALKLPLSGRVQFRTKDTVEVDSQLRPEDLSNFVRARVQTTKITAGADRTTFEGATVPTEPKRVLYIEVRPARSGGDMKSSLLVRDVTPLPPEPKVSDEEAWKRAGLRPDGKPLDPNHMD